MLSLGEKGGGVRQSFVYNTRARASANAHTGRGASPGGAREEIRGERRGERNPKTKRKWA